MNRVTRPMNRQSGMTLIEVLVAILIFSFGLLGFVGLQARAIQYSTSAEDSNRAALLANEITSEMVLAQTVNLPPAAISAWQARASDPAVGLPNAAATVAALSASSASITITWRAPRVAIGTANSVNQYVTQVVLP